MSSQTYDLIVSPEGFAVPAYSPFISRKMWNKLINPSKNSPKLKPEYQQALELIRPLVEALPKAHASCNDEYYVECFGVYRATSFQPSQFPTGSEWSWASRHTPSSKNWGQDLVDAILKHRKALSGLACFNWRGLSDASKQHQKLKDQVWSVKTPDPIKNAKDAESFVVYICEEEGYLQAKRKTGPLSKAWLFETEKAALQEVKRSHPRNGYIIARVQAKLVGLSNTEHAKGSFEHLQGAIALTDREALFEQLNKMDEQELKDKIKLLEQALIERGVEVEPKVEKIGSVRKRM